MPFAAALGGMVVPVVIYLAINRGLQRRVKTAYHMTAALLVLGIVTSLLKVSISKKR